MGKILIALGALGLLFGAIGYASKWSQVGLLNSVDALLTLGAPARKVASGVSFGPQDRQKLDIWVQPGGHVESNDTSLPAASLRELREETGLADARLVSEGIFDIDIHGIPARGSLAAHDHMDIRFWFESSQTHTILSDESHELAWMDREAIDRVTHEQSIWRMVNKTLTNR